MAESLIVNEIYLSLQGESTFAGLPCIFVRLTGCDLRCSYCDTAYAFTQGKKHEISQILAEIDRFAAPFANHPCPPGIGKLPLIELTGGEPLLQKQSRPLMATLCDAGYTVLVETSGAHDIGTVDSRVHRIMDMKCPSSGESERMLPGNVEHLTSRDEVKFVIGTQEDYEWCKAQIAEYDLASRCQVLLSWVAPLEAHQRDKSLKAVPENHTPISRKDLVETITADALPVRFQLQMHKFIWPPDQKGV